MDLRTVLLIVLAVTAALTIVFFQYFYKNSRKGSLKIILAALRFVTLFCGLLLLINPKFVSKDYFVEKANLILLVDNSTSMEDASTTSEISQAIAQIKADDDLSERFTIHQYGFGNTITVTDSVNFNQGNTDVSNALSTLNDVFVNGNNAIVLFSDGNQTLGRDYEYINLNKNSTIYPVVVGDTTQYEDISVGLINVNKYAFLRNSFPIETSIRYQGSQPASSTVTISINGNRVHQERVNLNSAKNSQTLNTVVEAQSVGIKTIKIAVGALENERNTVNNSKETAIEVIDEKTNVAIVSDMLHPDIGSLKKSIESNEQRSVALLKPNASQSVLEESDLIILYQPNRNFRSVYEFLKNSGSNYFTITGSKTDWNFLNRVQESFTVSGSRQPEEILPVLNNAFGLFGLGEFSVDGFPPLNGTLGDIQLNKDNETVIFQQLQGVNLDKPLFAILTESNQKEAVLFGENLWRWRAQVYRNDQSFQKFDEFIGNLMVYLGSNRQRNRLELDYELVFDNANMAKIRASYFDESYQFDANADISIKVEGVDNDFSRISPMLLKGSFYEVDLSDLDAGEYNFTVTVQDENLKRSGAFRILDFNPEKQLVSANYKKLGRLAANNKGQLYFLDKLEDLQSDLTSSNELLPVQKSRDNVVSLIDFRILLGLMILSLAAEWFIRKYNGLI
ncbi:VWA domain-containing protein [Flagellimonas halotolerans]|uniref:VWA domain-containing protein n=1 Tax=Flagellimonas halotolerans TaxID=3112164 RepID=A0ABU6IN01_9FLAO|nr:MULTISPECIES: VWA domain-containing protein [unclassified Allomuricauda]MEC3964625.1 VWA domain-containing protein [Muricauda sp. SYSU M86414]MEC4264494.1 VWA domain-containing protein [Muricauda sp. SYSU M84420]